jgi:type IV secretion system protein VirB10
VSFGNVAGERGLPTVSGAGSVQARVSSIMAIGLMSVLGLGMLGWYYSHAIGRQSYARQSALAASKSRAQGDAPLPSLGRIYPPRMAPPMPYGSATQLAADAPAVEPSREVPMEKESSVPPMSANASTYGASAAAAAPTKTSAQVAFERRLSGPAFAKQSELTSAGPDRDGGRIASEAVGGASGLGEVGIVPAAPASAPAARSGALPALLAPIATPAVQAHVLPTQRFLLSKGAFIDCTLETAIDTTLPGMTTCITATDTFSVDGKVVLLERGTKLVGETQSEVQQGSSRVFVLWTEARTPTGVIVPLASPGTDALGRSGLPGDVNRHFWDRFGAAILISVIDETLQSALHSGSGGTVIYGPSPAVDVMTEVLKSTINIPPTLIKNQGDRIQVFVARDLDFRSVYELHAH